MYLYEMINEENDFKIVIKGFKCMCYVPNWDWDILELVLDLVYGSKISRVCMWTNGCMARTHYGIAWSLYSCGVLDHYLAIWSWIMFFRLKLKLKIIKVFF